VLQKVVQRLYDNLSVGGRQERRSEGRPTQVEGTEGVPQLYLQSIRLQAQEHEQSDKTVALETRRHLAHLPPRPARRHRNQDHHGQAGTDREVVRNPRRRNPDDPPAKLENPEQCVGIDVGILKYAHDTDGTAVESLDLSDERERLERAQRDLSRKRHGSENWEKQRRVVAERHADLKNKRRDFLHKLSNYYAREYDLVAVEDLDTKGLIELPGNSRNRADAAWGTFLRMVKYKCEREGRTSSP